MNGTLFDTARPSCAVFSPCGMYRYTLNRMAAHYDGLVNWVMLNPSTADAVDNDPTIQRCISYTQDWGYGDLVVTNLFALRSTDPKGLRGHPNPVGPDNDRHIIEQARLATIVVCAWGAEPMAAQRAPAVLAILRGLGVPLRALGLPDAGPTLTASGAPLHPLFKPSRLCPMPWDGGPK